MPESTVKLSIVLPTHVHARAQEIATVEGLPLYKVVTDALVSHIGAKSADPVYREALAAYVEARQKEIVALQARLSAFTPADEG